MRRRKKLIPTSIAVAAILAAPAHAQVRFNRDVRPIMSGTCFRCHGPDKSSRMAGMRLDLRDEALKPTKSGVTPIVPGDPEKSAIVQRVFAATAAKRMPLASVTSAAKAMKMRRKAITVALNRSTLIGVFRLATSIRHRSPTPSWP